MPDVLRGSILTLIVAALALCPTALPGADTTQAEKPKPQTFLTVETAGPDYLAQGEYTNDWGGVQVIALGDDRFRAVISKGGLPGAGWDGEPRTEVEGKRAGDAVVFKNEKTGWTHSVRQGVFETKTDGGETYTMNKVQRTSPTLGAKPPVNAVILFDKDPEQWQGAHVDERGLLAAGTTTKKKFQAFQLHAEFFLPFKPLGRGQDRGNSGVYLQDRYEVQVLDSFGLKGENNECGGIYSKKRPSVNMCFPPLTWQTYDIDYQPAKFGADGKKTANAVATIRHNGVVIHDHTEIDGPTGGGKPESPQPGPIQIQGHGNPVFYRNIWLVEK
jgi:hypothetical protein